jgi:hypothetical protein
MFRTTPLQPSIALDRNKATRTKQGEGEEEVGKKKIADETLKYSNQLHIERLLFTSNITIAHKC